MSSDIKVEYKKYEKERIDLFLKKELNLTRSHVSSMIHNHSILVNSCVVNKPGLLLKNGDVIEIRNKKSDLNDTDLTIKFNILYEDDYLMVIDKPEGLLSHATNFQEPDNLVAEIKAYYLLKNYKLDNLLDLRNGLVHRLDKDTSGLLLVAKNRNIFNKLKNDIEKKNVKRYYYALVDSAFNSTQSLKVDLPLAHNNINTKMLVDKNGKKAITLINVLKNFKNHAFIECELLTGRTHQIRTHLSAINHPIYNDPLYGKKIEESGQFLMAYKLSFTHPVYNKTMEFVLPLKDRWIKKMKEFENE